MSGRRSHTRYNVSPAEVGTLRMLRGVVVESADDAQVAVISREPSPVGERLSLEISDTNGTVVLEVETTDSRAIATDGGIRHRVWLRVRNAAAVTTPSFTGVLSSQLAAADCE